MGKKMQMLVRGGRVYLPSGPVDADILVDDEKVAAFCAPGTFTGEVDKIIDASGKLVLPGLIDTHVHFREPGFTHKEDFETGTRAAAAGGVTLAVDMPNTKPSTNSPERFEEHRKVAETKAIVDFNHWPGPPHDLDQIETLMNMGAIGIKVFMMKDTKRGYPHMPELGITDDGYLMEIMRACKKHDAILAVHPHNQELCEHIEKRYFWEKGLTGPQDYAKALRWGDSIIYDTAFALLLILARSTGVRLHMLHLNTYLGVDMVKLAYDHGVNVTAEINPPHLFVTWKDVEEKGPYVLGTWTPPKDQEALWRACTENLFPVALATDHAPHALEEKEIGWQDMWKAHGGAPYVQHYLSLLLNAANAGRITIDQIVKVCCENPARIFGFYPRKGVIQPGSDADFVIVDLNRTETISKDGVQSKCGWTPFEGWKVTGVPVFTIVRGQVVAENGKIVGRPGYGRFVAPER
ncbi:MAG: dihydroorotase family protein [Firmicutes bacterium]|nr:dihydroorotase family protein [Bacillota bacterium]